MKTKILNTIAATVIFLLITGIFGFGGCMTLAGGFTGRNDAGIVLGFVWFFVVACGAMWLNLRMFGNPSKQDGHDQES